MADTFAGFHLREIGGVPVLWTPDPRFKTARVLFQLRRPLDSTAAARSVLPSLLLHGTERDPDRPSIARRMESLYGAVVVPGTEKTGEVHGLRLVLDYVAGRFLPGRPDQLGDGLAFLADIAARPRLVDGGFPEGHFDRERRHAVDAVRALIDDRGAYAYEEAVRRACDGEPMAISEHGSLDALRALDRRAPEAARDDFLSRGEASLVACGAFDDDELSRAVERFLDALPPREPEPIGPPAVAAPRAVRRHVERVDLQQSKLVMVMRFSYSEDPALWVGRRLLVAIFGGGPSSRLFREVREKRSLAYYASASADRYKGLLTVQVGLDEAAAADAEAEILRQFEAVSTGGFEDAELETARAQICNAVRRVEDSVSSRCQFAGEQWTLGTDRTPEQLLDEYVRADRELVLRAAEGVWLDMIYLLAPRSPAKGGA